ncbi:MAG: hypothetical protein ABW110_09825, partial [Steroidobacteraceae bacterium]
ELHPGTCTAARREQLRLGYIAQLESAEQFTKVWLPHPVHIAIQELLKPHCVAFAHIQFAI